MNNIGIIAEYNPYHKGHLYHLLSTKTKGKADNIVAIMSGNFVQRGEPAILDKWIRAEMAVKGGADLVLELPFIFACNNAEYFAHGAVKIFDKLNVISGISFGSETGSIDKLWSLAKLLNCETEAFKDILKNQLSLGLSFPKARYETVKHLTNAEMANLLSEPNNILAVEYLKQLLHQNSSMKAYAIKRKGEEHHDSATSIRRAISRGQNVEQLLPETTIKVLEKIGQKSVTDSEELFPLIMYKIMTSSESDLSEILSSGEGLENRLKKSIIKSKHYEDLVQTILSKRYTQTRIKRMLIHTLVGLSREDFFKLKEEAGLYARVLAFSQKGAKLLRHIKKNDLSQIPIITNINKEIEKENNLWKMLKYDIVATDIYNLCHYGDIYSRSDHVMNPYGEDRQN